MRKTETTVAIVDDHPVVIEGFSAGFLAEPGYKVVGTGATADEAIAIVKASSPDVIVMDLSMPGDVFAAISKISATTESSVVVFTAYSSLDSALRALDAGALGFVLKGASFDELLEAVHFASRKELYIARQYATQVMTALRARGKPEKSDVLKLNLRERQIIGLLVEACTNREIATRLNLSEKTVKRHMTLLMQKLHAKNRVQIAVNAQQVTDWRPPDQSVALQ